MAYFDRRNISWTATNSGCDTMSAAILLGMTGDPNGFGSIDASLMASAAGGFPGPVSPGEILSAYGQLLGPVDALGPHLTNGRADTTVGEVQAWFDGIAAPLNSVQANSIDCFVPFEVRIPPKSPRPTTAKLRTR